MDSFNPHTHAGCDVAYEVNSSYLLVSIHTPTQGVTLANLYAQGALSVSIHTPTQGVTPVNTAAYTRIKVSIHTPTQGVTGYTPAARVGPGRFNPHTHAGCDRLFFNNWLVRSLFQSTHPRRV